MAIKDSELDSIEDNQLAKLGDEIDEATTPAVCIFGFSFKKNTGDARMSQSAFVVNYLANVEGMRVHVHDP